MTPNPTNKSFLANNKYEFVIERLPNLVFFLQSVNVPDITLGSIVTSSPYAQIPRPSNLLSFGDLNLNYVVDENMESWFEIYNWIVNLGNPTSLDKLGKLTKVPGKKNSVMSDATLIVKSNANNPNIVFKFYDIFPTTLSGVQLTSSEGQEFLTSSITFTYTYYEASKI